MSEQQRDESGEFTEKVTDQDVLKVFDYADEPVLTAGEVATELPITREAVGRRLNRMREEGLVERKQTGASSIAWWAEVAPRLSDEERATTGVDPEDGFWDAEPGSSAEPTDAAKTDEYLADALANE